MDKITDEQCWFTRLIVVLSIVVCVPSLNAIAKESKEDAQSKQVRTRLLLLPSVPPDEGPTRFGLVSNTQIYQDIGDRVRFKRRDANDTEGQLDLQEWDLIYFPRGEVELFGRRISKSPKSWKDGWVVIISSAPFWPLRDTVEWAPRFQELVRVGGERSDYRLEISFDIGIVGSTEYTDQFGRWKLTEKSKIAENSSVSSFLWENGKLIATYRAKVLAITDGVYGTELICNGEIVFFVSEHYKKVTENFTKRLAVQRIRVCKRLNQKDDRKRFSEWLKDCESPNVTKELTFAALEFNHIPKTGFGVYKSPNFHILYSPYRFALPLLWASDSKK